MGQFGKANQLIIIDDDEEIDAGLLSEPESGVGYPRDFGKQHQEIEKFKPCDQPGVDCAQSVHGIAYKPNYETKVCEKVKLVSTPKYFGTSISRDKPHGAKEYTIVGRDTGGAKNRCQKDLNNEITIDLTKDIDSDTDIDKRDVTKITKYLAELREKYGKLINNKKAVMTDWNRNKSELEKIVTTANHGIDFTAKKVLIKLFTNAFHIPTRIQEVDLERAIVFGLLLVKKLWVTTYQCIGNLKVNCTKIMKVAEKSASKLVSIH